MVIQLCSVMKNTTAHRVAITQIVILLAYSVVLFCLAAFTTDDLELEDDERSKLRNGLYACAALYILPLLFALMLMVAVIRSNVGLVRMWIFISIIETVVLLAVTLAGSIYFAVILDSYYGLSIIGLQVIVSLWKMECIVLINNYYRENLLGAADPKLVA